MRRRRPSPINQIIIQPSELSQKFSRATEIETRIIGCTNFTAPVHSINNVNERMTQRIPLPTDVPFYPGPTYRCPPKPVRSFTTESHEASQSSNSSEIANMDPGVNLGFEEKFYFRKVLFQKLTKDPISCSFKEPQELNSLVKTGNFGTKIPAKISQHRQNTKSDTKKSP